MKKPVQLIAAEVLEKELKEVGKKKKALIEPFFDGTMSEKLFDEEMRRLDIIHENLNNELNIIYADDEVLE